MCAGFYKAEMDLTPQIQNFEGCNSSTHSGPCAWLQASFDVNDPTAAMHADCARAVEILKRMTGVEKGGTASKQNDILPLDFLKRCKVCLQ